MGNGEDRAVGGGGVSVFINQDVRTSAAARLADIEVCSIEVSCKDHSTSAGEGALVGVSGNVIQELE